MDTIEFGYFCCKLASGTVTSDNLETDHACEPILRAMFREPGVWRVRLIQSIPDPLLRSRELQGALDNFNESFCGDKFEPPINYVWLDTLDPESLATLTTCAVRDFHNCNYEIVSAALFALAAIPAANYPLSRLPMSSMMVIPELRRACGYFFGHRASDECWTDYIKLLTDETSELEFRNGLLQVLRTEGIGEKFSELIEVLPGIVCPDIRAPLASLLVKSQNSGNDSQRKQLRSTLEKDKLDALRRMALTIQS